MAPDETAAPTVGTTAATHRGQRRGRLVAIGAILVGIALSEGLLFVGETWPAIWGHVVTFVGCLLLIRRLDGDVAVLQVFALVPLFRVVNLGMPVFFPLTVYWLPLVYGPLVPALYLLDDHIATVTTTWGWRRGLLLAPVAIPLGAGLAEVEQLILQSGSLIPTWSVANLALITVVMVGFVGFVEEYLFRGLLQQTLATEIGRWPGLVVASAVFGLMHSGYGIPVEILFAASIGFLFGLLYDYLESLVFVSLVHGILNVFLFAVLPMQGSLLF